MTYIPDPKLMSSPTRRTALKAGIAGALAVPAVAHAQQTFNWKMTSAYGKGAPFYMDGPGSATDLAKRIADMSGGRLKIQVFGAGELVPAFEGFDAVRAGTVEMNHANSYFWTGKTAAAQYFTAVPFGMNFQGMNGWFYDGGGIDLWNEVYAPFGMIAMPDAVAKMFRGTWLSGVAIAALNALVASMTVASDEFCATTY